MFRNENTIRNILVAPKETDIITQKSRMTYRFKCIQNTVKRNILGSQEGPLEIDLKNSLGLPPPCKNMVSLLDTASMGTVFQLEVGVTWHYKTIKESQFIRVNDPYINRNLGEFQLPPHMGLRSYKTHLLSSLSNATTATLQWALIPKTRCKGDTNTFNISKYWSFPQGVPIPLAPVFTPFAVHTLVKAN